MANSLSVLVTGSAGRIGGAACAGLLARGHRVRGFDVRPTATVADSVIGDLADAAAVRQALDGVQAVVHLGATPDEDDFCRKLVPNNVIGVYNVLEGARQAGVSRVLVASTGQVVMGHEGPWPITPEMPYSPRNWYASAKVLAEVAGQVYAYVHGLSVIVVRLGWCPRDRQHADSLAGDEFGKDVYLSPGDAGRFFACAIEASAAIRYAVVFATSRPLQQTRYDIESARRLLGYVPQDTWPRGTEIAYAGERPATDGVR